MSKVADAKAESSTAEVRPEDAFYKSDAKADSSTASSETPVKAGAVKTEVAPEPTDQEQDPEDKGKSPRTSWAEMRAARYRAEAERDFLKQQLDEQRKAASLPAKAEEKTVATGKPKLSDFTEKIGSDYPTYEDAQEAYQDARDSWNRSDWETKKSEEQRLAKEAEDKRKADEEVKAQKATWDERADEARKSIKDFDAIAYSEQLPINPATHAFLMKSEIGPRVLHALGSDLKEAVRIHDLDALATVIALTKMETAILAKAESAKGSTPHITRAPRPAVDVGGPAASGTRELSIEETIYGRN